MADSLKRLIRPSIETELLAAAKEKADDEAIGVFAENLRQLLLSAPLGQKRVIAIDPGFRTGCKVVVLDSQGNLVHNTTIYPHPPQGRYAEAAETLWALAGKYRAEAFAIGDGTAGRETEQLVRGLGLDGAVEIFMVSEDGASVYSAAARPRGVPRLRRDGARLGEHRPEADRPALGAGEDRPQVDRRRAIPAQRRPGKTQGQAQYGGRKLREQGRGEHQHRLEAHPHLYFRTGAGAGGEHRGVCLLYTSPSPRD